MTPFARLTALLAAAATVLTLAAAPASADLKRKDAVKILGALAALYIINEAQQRGRQRDLRRAPAPQPQPQPSRGTTRAPRSGETYSHIHADGSGGGDWHDHTVGVPHARAAHPAPAARPAPVAPPPQVTRAPLPDPLPLPARPTDRVEIRLLPEQCRADVSNAIETIQGYDAACLQNAVALPGSLPPSCLLRHPDRTIYEAACLRREGWSTRLARN